jgi:hypothetical protein
MKRLLLAAALAPLSFAAAHAGTISGADTSTHQTSTEGDITITSTGSVAPATSSSSGTVAITINSSNNVDNEGTISVTETTTGTGTNQGIANGPFANGSDRFAIQVIGAGPFTGNITNGSGATITVIGENSAGISVLTGLNGFIDDAGAINVTGGNANTTDVSYGIFSATGATITGNVSVTGTVTVTGQNATGVALNGDVGGSVSIGGAISATGFRSTTVPADPTVLANLTSDQLLAGGPALSVGGNVGGGLSIDAATAASGNIAATTGGSLAVFGPAPALLVGGAAPITIGNGTSGYSIAIGGEVHAAGDYPNFNGVGVQIGGFNGLAVSTGGVAPGDPFSTVSLPGGIDISGNVTATATGNTSGQGGATALEIGSDVNTPRITVSGSVVASTLNSLTSGAPAPTTGILIDSGAPVGATVLSNSGTIEALIGGVPGVAGITNSAGGVFGQAVAILDAGGGLSEVINTGNITALLTPIVSGQLAQGPAVAIFENNSQPFTLLQCNTVDGTGNCTTSGGNATSAPNIRGSVIFAGTGNATIDLFGGNLTGAIVYGNATSNVLDIENGGLAKGPLSVATGGSVAINVNNGRLFMTEPGNVSVSTLHVGSQGSIIFAGDPGNPSSTIFNVAGNATLDSGAQVGLTLVAPLSTSTSFTVIQAANLSAGNVSSDLLGQIPFLVQATISTTPTTLTITAAPKTAAELGLNPAETAMFPAWSVALPSDPAVAADVLSKTDRPSFIRVYDQFLPDYQGGPFELLVEGQQEIARTEAETPVKLATDSTRGWVQEIGYLNNQNTTSQVNGYEGAGFGIAGGIERARGDTAIGLSAAFITTDTQDQTQPSDQTLNSTAFEVGAYWRKGGGAQGLVASASVNGALVTVGSKRFLIDQTNGNDIAQTTPTEVTREAKASWLAGLFAANVSVGYQFESGRFYVRPEGSIDYVVLFESAYHETGGGPAYNLSVNARTSSQVDARADVVLGMTFGQSVIWRPELTFGYRTVLSGGPAATTANFAGGQSFTINPQFNSKGAFLGRIGVRASGLYADFSADAGGEFSNTYQVYNARAAARFLF